ncbi:5-oxoprolinase subunit PxpA [Tenacibaculum tangerinum]|uniref:5-oxoprolinase subunit PxpA n=1 Tax=Tenacibaculum tangerinum TaxID=3038772 RepID=A0ABY8KY59_9FLAO|nr:5-oxoprolinase subunit PxpA [Tenacibaculum tangerinum]WGH74184.1 5-oxoprolinase subunit PxpA [Tenacibaculum tangerinum]
MYSNYSIDINCDVGEGVGNEHLLLPYISSCNIACGAHAGSVATIDNVIHLAKKHQVKIGAHPSFPDRKNLGRAVLPISSEALQESIEEQIRLLKERADLQGVKLHHVKPHGALYNVIAKDKKMAQLVIRAIQNTCSNVFLYVPYNSVIAEEAVKKNLQIVYEAFADRNYNDDLSLVSRSKENALITDKEAVFIHIKNIILHQKVTTIAGTRKIIADTICVHGDTKNAVALVAYIHAKLKENNIQIA